MRRENQYGLSVLGGPRKVLEMNKKLCILLPWPCVSEERRGNAPRCFKDGCFSVCKVMGVSVVPSCE